MAGTWKKMTYFAFALPNEPGELGRFLSMLRDGGIDLMGLWGYAEGEENPQISCVPVSPGKFRSLLREGGIEPEEGQTFYLSGENRPGALVEAMEKIGAKDINIDAIETVSAGSQFGCFLWTDEAHWGELEKLLT